MRTPTRYAAAGGLALVLALGGVACSDEDGDGATTDEEVDQIDETLEDVGNDLDDAATDAEDRIQQETEAGEDEVEENDAEG
jgi:uncharacterized membrane protein YukC